MVRGLKVLLMSSAILAMPWSHSKASVGRGHLEAEGRGSVKMHATGHVEFELFGEGVLVVQHQSHLRIEIHGRGDVTVTRDDALVVSSFTGTVNIAGERINASFRRGPVRVSAVGHGQAVLRGRGHFVANDRRGNWSERGTEVRW